MLKTSADRIIEEIEGKKIVIVGAGNIGKEILDYFLEKKVEVVAIYDNNASETVIRDIPVMKPCKLDGSDMIYVICVQLKYREELIEQLKSYGVNENEMRIYYSFRDVEYMRTIKEDDYKEEISNIYFEVFGKKMDWENPQTYNEIINWEKLYCNDLRRGVLSDKYRVRNWVKEKIGSGYFTKIYGVWENPRDIEYRKLPLKYVLKVNNGSGRNIVVEDSRKIDKEKITKQLCEWITDDFALHNLEMHYRKIKPLVYCEEYLDAKMGDFVDIKFYCFHGEPMFVHRIKLEHTEKSVARFYDMNWNAQSFNHWYNTDDDVVERPIWFDEIKQLTEILCKEFEHIRVDWFALPDGRVYFAELTFSSCSGFCRFIPDEYDGIFGKLIREGNV